MINFTNSLTVTEDLEQNIHILLKYIQLIFKENKNLDDGLVVDLATIYNQLRDQDIVLRKRIAYLIEDKKIFLDDAVEKELSKPKLVDTAEAENTWTPGYGEEREEDEDNEWDEEDEDDGFYST